MLELPGDRIYNYSTFTIEPDARLNFRSLTSDTTVQLRVTGDVTIAGAIDVGPGSLTITSPGSITFLNGSRLAGGAIHLWSNQIDISSGAVVALVNSGEITLAPVPLPGALALFTPALLGLGFFATRSRQSK
ncbi:MAG TPA: hypothetical protein VJS66_03780 [Burkholderiales bacterium]|nr:hypothetical protein [Burkholderiales bacterium]